MRAYPILALATCAILGPGAAWAQLGLDVRTVVREAKERAGSSMEPEMIDPSKKEEMLLAELELCVTLSEGKADPKSAAPQTADRCGSILKRVKEAGIARAKIRDTVRKAIPALQRKDAGSLREWALLTSMQVRAMEAASPQYGKRLRIHADGLAAEAAKPPKDRSAASLRTAIAGIELGAIQSRQTYLLNRSEPWARKFLDMAEGLGACAEGLKSSAQTDEPSHTQESTGNHNGSDANL